MMTVVRRRWHWLAVAILVACSGSPEAPPPAPQAQPTTAVTSAPPPTTAGTVPNSPAPTSTGGGFFSPPPMPDAGEVACRSIAVESESITIEVPVEVPVEIPYEVTEEVPKAIYLMLDSSQSMVTDQLDIGDLWLLLCLIPGFCPPPDAPPPSKWDFARAGITQFLDDPASSSLKVGINYFPDRGQCDGSGYDTPAVPVGELPGNAQAIKDNMASVTPANFTPTAGALRGLIRFCEQYQVEHPNEKCVGVLITDGAPTECDPQDQGGLAALAADAAAKDIQIFAAGMVGASFPILHAIAQAGGGDCTPDDPATWACDMTENADAFLKALQEIASQTTTRTRTEFRTEIRTQIEVEPVPCEWGVPAPPEGEEFDPDKINVRVTQSGTSQSLGRVPSAAECPNFQGGWFFDDPATPTKVSVCPQTCEQIQNVQNQTIEVLFGCKYTPAVPR